MKQVCGVKNRTTLVANLTLLPSAANLRRFSGVSGPGVADYALAGVAALFARLVLPVPASLALRPRAF